jgi:RES domain-containing protein
MEVYRVGKTKWAKDLSGEGSRLHGGRWNHPGTACLYASQNRALSVLEYTVNTNIYDIPRALSITTIVIPDDLIGNYPLAELPGNWKEYPAPSSTKDFGTHQLKLTKHAVLRLPSSIIPNEYNFILNPAHARSGSFKVTHIEDFVYDVRIKMV